jgi:hypothetical protein
MTPYRSATLFPWSVRRGVFRLNSSATCLQASGGSGEMLTNWRPRLLNSLLVSRSPTCWMQGIHPGPMLKYSSVGLPRKSESATGFPSAEGSVKLGAPSPGWRSGASPACSPSAPPHAAVSVARSRRTGARLVMTSILPMHLESWLPPSSLQAPFFGGRWWDRISDSAMKEAKGPRPNLRKRSLPRCLRNHRISRAAEDGYAESVTGPGGARWR